MILLLVALFAYVFWGHLYRLWILWQEPDWSHGYLIPLFCLYMVNTRKAELLADGHRGSIWGLPALIACLAVYVLSIVWKIGYPQQLAMVASIAAIVLLTRGWKTLWLTLFPIGMLLLAIPPPERLYRSITQPLQQFAAWAAGLILNTFPGGEIERGGINIAFFMDDGRQGAFTVAGACSGMRSLMAFAALGLAMAYFTPRPVWHRVAMAVAVVPVALFCNILRVIITGSLQMYGYPDLASGTAHSLLGLLLFGLGFCIYLAILWVLDHLYVPDAEPNTATEPET